MRDVRAVRNIGPPLQTVSAPTRFPQGPRHGQVGSLSGKKLRVRGVVKRGRVQWLAEALRRRDDPDGILDADASVATGFSSRPGAVHAHTSARMVVQPGGNLGPRKPNCASRPDSLRATPVPRRRVDLRAKLDGSGHRHGDHYRWNAFAQRIEIRRTTLESWPVSSSLLVRVFRRVWRSRGGARRSNASPV